MVLSTPRPTIDLTAAREALAKSIADRAKVSTLHDMLVVDVEGARLVEVATIVRDDPSTRCLPSGVPRILGKVKPRIAQMGPNLHYY